MIAFNAGGYFFIYFQLQNCFKQVAFNRINDYMPIEELELIKVPLKGDAGDYERVNDREFSLDGKMYDIYEEKISGDTLSLYCVNDENEDIVNSAFATYINAKKNDKPNSAIANIIKIFITIALEPVKSDNYTCNRHENLDYSFLSNIQTIFIDIPSPPPRFSC